MIRNEKTEKSGTVRLGAFVDRAIEAEKIRHPLRSTGRLLNVLSFGRFGIPSAGGWKRLDAKDSGTDDKLLMAVLWTDYWAVLPDIASLYENGLEFPEERVEEENFMEPPQLESGEPEYYPPILMLPAPRGPEFIPEVESEPLYTDVSFVDAEVLSAEAEEVADDALSFFKGDHPRWEDPHGLLAEIEATLVATVPHHPDKESLYERIAFVHDCVLRIDEFTDCFDRLMNGSQDPDASWNAPWLAAASQDLQSQGLMPTPDNLYRASLPHYLVERWKSTVTDSPVGDADMRSYNGNVRPPDARNTPSRPFRPASDTESGF